MWLSAPRAAPGMRRRAATAARPFGMRRAAASAWAGVNPAWSLPVTISVGVAISGSTSVRSSRPSEIEMTALRSIRRLACRRLSRTSSTASGSCARVWAESSTSVTPESTSSMGPSTPCTTSSGYVRRRSGRDSAATGVPSVIRLRHRWGRSAANRRPTCPPHALPTQSTAPPIASRSRTWPAAVTQSRRLYRRPGSPLAPWPGPLMITRRRSSLRVGTSRSHDRSSMNRLGHSTAVGPSPTTRTASLPTRVSIVCRSPMTASR